MTERRKFQRFATSLKARCRLSGTDHFIESSVRNLSKEGALIAVSQQLALNADLILSIDMPGEDTPILAASKVVWQDRYSLKDEGLYAKGVKFTKIDKADKGRLLEHIYTQWLKLIDESKKV